ncbi:MAG: tRNA (guanosine(46)-N7)-methyltransferase TrmB [Taibaiella sp.]|nr:tRNA (guanosine(46)-N7)-methyltransferase TrmB [Taibaiella sp.]
MGQKKLIRFEEIKSFDNVFEYPEDKKGKWSAFFGNSHDITLELACGKGEYTIGLARMYPARNLIGVDLKGNRIWSGAKNAIEEGLDNVAFLRTQIDKINHYFDRDEVAEIWITFPDPQLRGSKIRKRLTHPKFLRMYQSLLKPGGKVHLKTDSPDLYHFTKEVIGMYGLSLLTDDDHVFSKSEVQPELKIRTHYESLDIAGSNRIHYLQFLLDRELPLELDGQLKQMFSNKHSDAPL